MRITRRSALLGLTAAVSFGRHAFAVGHAATDKRFVVVILRGALDGLSAVVPYGDPALAGQRGEILPGAVGSLMKGARPKATSPPLTPTNSSLSRP